MRDSKLDDIKAGEDDRAWLEDWKFWMALLHGIALSSTSMIAHPHHQRSFPLRSSAPDASGSTPASTHHADESNVAASGSAAVPATKKSVVLTSESLAFVQSLPAPREGQVTCALQTLQSLFTLLNKWLELQDLPRVSTPTVKQANKVLKYNAVVLRWYPNYRKQKLWVKDTQLSGISTALWRRQQMLTAGEDTTAMLLSRQAFVLLLDQDGIRPASWADAADRRQGEEGSYQRCGNMICRLIDWIGDEALFIIFGSSSASKEQSPAGDANSASFAFGSRPPGEAGGDVAKALLLLLLKMGAFSGDLEQALTDPTFGRQLISANGYRDFHVLPEARNAPLLVDRVRAKAKEPLKHPKDRPAPSLVDFPNVRPLSNPPRECLSSPDRAISPSAKLSSAPTPTRTSVHCQRQPRAAVLVERTKQTSRAGQPSVPASHGEPASHLA